MKNNYETLELDVVLFETEIVMDLEPELEIDELPIAPLTTSTV